MKFEEKTLDSTCLYQGRIIRLRKDTVELHNGRRAIREVVEHPGGVCVAALTRKQELLMVRQFRYPYREELLELPAGKIDPGEEPLVCGRRELREETGAAAGSYTSLGRLYPSPGYFNEIIYLYLAEGLTFGEQHPDEDEFLDLVRIPLKDAVKMVMENKITDAKTQTAVLKVWLMRGGERSE